MMKFDPKQREKKNRSDDKEGTITHAGKSAGTQYRMGEMGRKGNL